MQDWRFNDPPARPAVWARPTLPVRSVPPLVVPLQTPISIISLALHPSPFPLSLPSSVPSPVLGAAPTTRG
eukprot:2988252-Pyramimonas_sp.AAC.1